MSEKISVVTDSTSSLSKKYVQEMGIGVISAVITFGDQTFRDGIDIEIEKFLPMLIAAHTLPTTGAPSLNEYYQIYQNYPGDVISIHLGSKFSGIFASAQRAAEEMGNGRIHPKDSKSVALGIGFQVIRAVELINQGAKVEEIMTELEDMSNRTTVMASFDTLKYAEKGGRIKHLEAKLGGILQVKPILEIKNNQIDVIEKPRTRGKSLTRLIELTEALGPLERVGVLHANSPEDAEYIVDQIKRFHHGDVMLGNIGSVLLVHGGPGIVGVGAVKAK